MMRSRSKCLQSQSASVEYRQGLLCIA
jgi:hypothetical protein